MIAKQFCMLFLSATALLVWSSAANAYSNPCTWLTADEVSAATGAKMTEKVEAKFPNTGKLHGCGFRTTSLTRGINIETYDRPNFAAAQQFFTQLTKDAARIPGTYGLTHSNPITPVPGVGDEAAGVGNVLFVRKGGDIFTIGITDSLEQAATASGFEKAKNLAPVIISRM